MTSKIWRQTVIRDRRTWGNLEKPGENLGELGVIAPLKILTGIEAKHSYLNNLLLCIFFSFYPCQKFDRGDCPWVPPRFPPSSPPVPHKFPSGSPKFPTVSPQVPPRSDGPDLGQHLPRLLGHHHHQLLCWRLLLP